MIKDRRFYNRFELSDTAVVLFAPNGEEISGKITDISEESIGIDIPISDKDKFEVHGTFMFQFADNYNQGSQSKTKVVTALAIIIRHEVKDSVCHLGCIVRDEAFRSYATKRKFSAYYNNVAKTL
ncbi:hypothetical protein [Butyrivibrio sp. JL13D10]|uniref:hypothetical protein n=1 Tax=Butyrivibrio sp. JL13D10 TaxID=3236815 RepID=UPI0038B5A010